MVNLIPGCDAMRRRTLLVGALAIVAAASMTITDSQARELPPSVPPPKPFVLRTPALRSLPNGLGIIVIERRSLPIVSLRLVVKAGAEADPDDRAGLAQLAASLLDQGTARRSAQQIAEAIDFVGGTIATAAGWDVSYAALTVLTDHTELAFDLLSDIAIRPAFPPDEIERKRQQTVSALEVLEEDPGYVADNGFRRLVFEGTPYGHPANGTVETVGRISRKDLVNFHRLHYSPENSLLAVVGDIGAGEAERFAGKYFGSWSQGKGRPTSLATEWPAPSRRTVVVIDKPDAVQTEIRLGNLGIPRASPDYYALTVANQILGGPATNRLFKALRSQQGLTYGASSDLICNRTIGSWVAKTFTRTSATAQTVEVALEQMKRLRNATIRKSELETAQAYLVGNMALAFETSEGVAKEILVLLVNDLPLGYWSRFPEEIRKLRAEQVLAATRRYLDPDRSIIVLVGDARRFVKELRRLGPVRVISLRSLDLGSPTLKRAPDSPSPNRPLQR